MRSAVIPAKTREEIDKYRRKQRSREERRIKTRAGTSIRDRQTVVHACRSPCLGSLANTRFVSVDRYTPSRPHLSEDSPTSVMTESAAQRGRIGRRRSSVDLVTIRRKLEYVSSTSPDRESKVSNEGEHSSRDVDRILQQHSISIARLERELAFTRAQANKVQLEVTDLSHTQQALPSVQLNSRSMDGSMSTRSTCECEWTVSDITSPVLTGAETGAESPSQSPNSDPTTVHDLVRVGTLLVNQQKVAVRLMMQWLNRLHLVENTHLIESWMHNWLDASRDEVIEACEKRCLDMIERYQKIKEHDNAYFKETTQASAVSLLRDKLPRYLQVGFTYGLQVWKEKWLQSKGGAVDVGKLKRAAASSIKMCWTQQVKSHYRVIFESWRYTMRVAKMKEKTKRLKGIALGLLRQRVTRYIKGPIQLRLENWNRTVKCTRAVSETAIPSLK